MPTATLTCPNCGFSKKIPSANLPHRPMSVGCPSCKISFRYTPGDRIKNDSPTSVSAQPVHSQKVNPIASKRITSSSKKDLKSVGKISKSNQLIVLLFVLIMCLVGGRLWLEGKAMSVPYPYWLSASERGVAILYGDKFYVVGHDGTIQWTQDLPVDTVPCQIAWHGDELWVSDWRNDRILKFSGDQISIVPLQGPPIEAHLNVAVEQLTNRLFVADSQASRIAIYDSSGKFEKTISHIGHARGELYFPKDITFDGNGHLIVGNTLRAGIDVFNTDGTFVDTMAEPKGKLGYNFLTDFAVDQQNLVTLECNLLVTGCVVASYDRSGKLLGTQPQSPGVEAAGDVAVWDGTAYVSDCLNRQVMTFSATSLDPLGPLSDEINAIGETFNKRSSLYSTLSNLSLAIVLVGFIAILVVYWRSKSN